MKKFFDFVLVNFELIRVRIAGLPGECILAQDSSVFQKAGKNTFGVGFQWDNTAGHVSRGLEVDLLAVII